MALRLALEALQRPRPVAAVAGEHLHRHRAAEPQVGGPVDLAHAARAEERVEPVAPDRLPDVAARRLGQQLAHVLVGRRLEEARRLRVRGEEGAQLPRELGVARRRAARRRRAAPRPGARAARRGAGRPPPSAQASRSPPSPRSSR